MKIIFFNKKTVQFKYEEIYRKKKMSKNNLMRKRDHHAKDEYTIQ